MSHLFDYFFSQFCLKAGYYGSTLLVFHHKENNGKQLPAPLAKQTPIFPYPSPPMRELGN